MSKELLKARIFHKLTIAQHYEIRDKRSLKAALPKKISN